MSLEGQRLGEFEILERIGQGGMGAVYRAVQSSLQRTVALKTLRPALAADPEYIERFRREAIAAAGLSHQNLVQVYSAGENDGLHWFAMEFIKGESAHTRLKRMGCIDLGEAIAIGVHVANALDYAWKRARLIHRDIKPDNIFLSGEGDVKLGDLGLAKIADQSQQLTITGALMGTPYYVSPEQAEGSKDLDLRADIYSLGCTLYRLVSGKTPFTGNNAVAVMTKHVTQPTPDIRSVFPACPPVLAEVILKMMQKDPAARQQGYEEVNADLRRAFDALSETPVPVPGVVASRPVAVAAAAGKMKANKVAAWIGGGIAMCVAVAALVYFSPRKQAAGGARHPGALFPPEVPPDLANATKDKPFVNSLGMRFVPVPILSGPTAGQRVLFGVWDVRVQDYAAYASANPKVDGAWKTQHKDDVPAGREMDHPVVGVCWEDANAFCDWLSEKEMAEGVLPKGVRYRLPSDEEWSWAAGLTREFGVTPAEKSLKNSADFPWGKEWPPRGKAGNYADEAYHAKFPVKENRMGNLWIEGYSEGYATTSPVGSFPANAYGLYDIGGNVWQWCEDWYDASQNDRVLRGASWNNYDRKHLLLSFRYHNLPTHRLNDNHGIRCVLGVSAR
ncbi:MAG: bifunctional serine/threonine-protein kinase/formylglycine-generating enzyme family protein [Chthoniobacteraceae bacterium]